MITSLSPPFDIIEKATRTKIVVDFEDACVKILGADDDVMSARDALCYLVSEFPVLNLHSRF